MSARNVPEFDFNLRLAKRIEEGLKSEGFVETSLLVTEGKPKPGLFERAIAAHDLRPERQDIVSAAVSGAVK